MCDILPYISLAISVLGVLAMYHLHYKQKKEQKKEIEKLKLADKKIISSEILQNLLHWFDETPHLNDTIHYKIFGSADTTLEFYDEIINLGDTWLNKTIQSKIANFKDYVSQNMNLAQIRFSNLSNLGIDLYPVFKSFAQDIQQLLNEEFRKYPLI